MHPIIIGVGGKILIAVDLKVYIASNNNYAHQDHADGGYQESAGENSSLPSRV